MECDGGEGRRSQNLPVNLNGEEIAREWISNGGRESVVLGANIKRPILQKKPIDQHGNAPKRGSRKKKRQAGREKNS